jgi:hypothetical protein
MCKSTGCCGSLFRLLLIIINLIVFIFGGAILGLGIGLKYVPQLTKLLDIPSVNDILNPLFIFLVSFGSFLLLVSLFGLIGSCCGNRCFLVLYDIVIGTLLIIHIILFIVAIVFAGSAKTELRNLLDESVNSVLTNYNNLNISSLPPNLVPANVTDEIKENCKYYTIVTEVLSCCEFNSSYAILAENCCAKNSSKTCVDTVFEPIDQYTDLLIYLPNGLTLAFEFFIFIAVIYIIVKLGKHKKDKRWQREHVELNYQHHKRSKYDR